MSVRTWRGWTRSEDADGYTEYLEASGLSEYRETEGNRGTWLLRRADGGETEFLVISMWEDMDAVRRFAGDEPDRAVFYENDDRYLTRYDAYVYHYEEIRSP